MCMNDNILGLSRTEIDRRVDYNRSQGRSYFSLCPKSKKVKIASWSTIWTIFRNFLRILVMYLTVAFCTSGDRATFWGHQHSTKTPGKVSESWENRGFSFFRSTTLIKPRVLVGSTSSSNTTEPQSSSIPKKKFSLLPIFLLCLPKFARNPLFWH